MMGRRKVLAAGLASAALWSAAALGNSSRIQECLKRAKTKEEENECRWKNRGGSGR